MLRDGHRQAPDRRPAADTIAGNACRLARLARRARVTVVLEPAL